MKFKRSGWGMVAIIVLFTIATSFSHFNGLPVAAVSERAYAAPTPENRDTRDLRRYGSVKYSAVRQEIGSEWVERERKNRRYDNEDWVYKTFDGQPGGVGKISDDPAPSPFPVEESFYVVVGEVRKAEAFPLMTKAEFILNTSFEQPSS